MLSRSNVRGIVAVKGLAVVLAAASIVTGCGRVVTQDEQKFTAEDLQAARKAMPFSEVSLMLRTGCAESEIIKQIEQRHLPAKLDPPTEQSVRRFGASPALIRALKDDANILTARQRTAYEQLVAQQEAKAQATGPADDERTQAYAMEQELERQRKQQLAAQTLQNAQNMQDRVTIYENAHREYTIKKGQLEYQIAKEQAYINQARGRGAGDDALADRIQTLERYKLELSDLKEPTR